MGESRTHDVGPGEDEPDGTIHMMVHMMVFMLVHMMVFMLVHMMVLRNRLMIRPMTGNMTL